MTLAVFFSFDGKDGDPYGYLFRTISLPRQAYRQNGRKQLRFLPRRLYLRQGCDGAVRNTETLEQRIRALEERIPQEGGNDNG